MKSFEYVAPGSVREATALLDNTWGKTEILAGGTDLVTCLKQNLTTPARVVSLKNIAQLKGITKSGEAIRIGATTTLADLVQDPVIRESFPALITAAEAIGSPQMLAMGTVGGELCQRPRCWYFRNGFGLLARQGDISLVREGDNRYHAIFDTDGSALFVSASRLGPVFVAFGATVEAEGPEGRSRQIPAAQFFQVPKDEQSRETALQANEILTAIEVPLNGFKNAYYEVRQRHGLDWPYVTATVALRKQGGVIADARVVLGHVAPIPWVAPEAGAALRGSSLDEAMVTRSAEAAVTTAKPLSRNSYKVQLVKTAVKRAALEAAKS
jgi:xanthine dehydrogenase YagS FAD-binding subunit